MYPTRCKVAVAVGLYVQASRVGLRVQAIYVTRVQSDSLSQIEATLESDNSIFDTNFAQGFF